MGIAVRIPDMLEKGDAVELVPSVEACCWLRDGALHCQAYGELLSPCFSRVAGASGQNKLALQHANAELATSFNPVRCQNAHMRLAVESIAGSLEYLSI